MTQSINGVTITNVVHTYTASTDTTTALSADAAQVLSTTPGVVEVFVNGRTTADACTVTQLGAPATSSSIACDIVDTVNVTDIRFVVNG